MIFILKFIAISMAIFIAQRIFPTFWGGFWFVILFQVFEGLSISFTRTKDET